jgi:hypothetical protein
MKNFTTEALAGWIKGLQQAAKEDEQFSVSWFIPTEEEPFSIVGGWLETGFDPNNQDCFCISKSDPKYAMAVKVVINEGPYAYCDFETLNMPMDINNPEEVDDTCLILEWDDNPAAIADFFRGEWERITNEYQEVL